jgi:hypothetical protein
LTLTIQFCDISQSFVSATKYENTSTPLLYPYLYQCYRNPSTLFFGDHLISSSVGAQQGDPFGPMIFSLAIQPIILSLNSELNIWYWMEP